jgi:HJR/Mrr/RecB family endonuclease
VDPLQLNAAEMDPLEVEQFSRLYVTEGSRNGSSMTEGSRTGSYRIEVAEIDPHLNRGQ